jgi:hypothetical protein
MHFEKYEIQSSSACLRFEFFSKGPKGKIKKQIEFEPFEPDSTFFNIGFGDVDDKGKINDLAITGNADSQKVLATVALSVFKFFERYPNAKVFATGSTKSRTRLYRIGITNNLLEIEKNFIIYGFFDECWSGFEKGKDYEAFLITLKNKK